jgi:hypothetical protein
MGTCKYCGQSAGLFSSQHKECFEEAEKNQALGIKVIRALVEVAATNKDVAAGLTGQINKAASTYKLAPEIVGRTLLATLDDVSRAGPIESSVAELLGQSSEAILGDCDNVLPGSPYYSTYRPTILNLGLSRNLWCLMKGEKFSALPTPCDIVLQKGEVRLAEFGTAMYRKTVMVSSHAGGYNGVSVRIASGLYYRFGGYSGNHVSYPDVQNIDTGFIVLTNIGMVFAGQNTTFRVPYRSVIRFKAYPDGLGFFRSAGSGREEIFTVVDPVLTKSPFMPADAVTLPVGWFLYNLVTFVTAQNQK